MCPVRIMSHVYLLGSLRKLATMNDIGAIWISERCVLLNWSVAEIPMFSALAKMFIGF